jgi:hypothetical protein
VHQLTELLSRATERLTSPYFQVKLDGGDPIYRERVYCYELYHQLRCHWPADTPFYLNGELDKAAHPILRKLGADYAKPDLLIHRPGYMAGNNTIIEVKSSNAQRDGIVKDLKTLALFRTKVNYQRAIYLLFGYEAQDAVARVCRAWNEIGELPPIELWVHTAPGEPAREVPIGADT